MSLATPRIEILPRSLRLALVVGLLLLLGFPLFGSEYYVQMLTRMMILAIFAMSLDLLQGVTGLVSLGHAAYFGLAGYALALLAPADAPASLWWSLPMAAGLAGLAALIVGLLVVRTHGIYFIMVTMAFAQMIYYLFFDNRALGGSDGVYVFFKPSMALGWNAQAWDPLNLETPSTFFYLTLLLMVVVYLFLRRLLWSPFGRALSGIRVNEHRMRALGFATQTYKLVAFTLAGALAGVAGYLWAASTGYVNPELLGFHLSAHAVMMVILGGMGNFAGAMIGAFSFEYLLHLFKDLPEVAGIDLGRHWQLWMGSFIVLTVLFAPRGLIGLLVRMLCARDGKTGEPS